MKIVLDSGGEAFIFFVSSLGKDKQNKGGISMSTGIVC